MLEAEKDRADRARALVCEELASSSQKLAVEQAEKRRMEQRIAELASKMLTSSNSSAEELAKRKHTLDRQRLVMISLTQRLHERDVFAEEGGELARRMALHVDDLSSFILDAHLGRRRPSHRYLFSQVTAATASP